MGRRNSSALHGNRAQPSSERIRRLEEARKFSENILNSDDYQQSVMDRVRNHTLPAAIEQLLYFYAYGKPIENYEITVSENPTDLSKLTDEQLQERVTMISEALRNERLRANVGIKPTAVIPFQPKSTDVH